MLVLSFIFFSLLQPLFHLFIFFLNHLKRIPAMPFSSETLNQHEWIFSNGSKRKKEFGQYASSTYCMQPTVKNVPLNQYTLSKPSVSPLKASFRVYFTCQRTQIRWIRVANGNDKIDECLFNLEDELAFNCATKIYLDGCQR